MLTPHRGCRVPIDPRHPVPGRTAPATTAAVVTGRCSGRDPRGLCDAVVRLSPTLPTTGDHENMPEADLTSAPASPQLAVVPSELRGLIARTVTRWRDAQRHHAPHAAQQLADAILSGDLRLAYQPIIDLVDNRTVAVEALIRLDDPPSEDLTDPPAIIGVAEASGLIVALGAHVLATSCAQLARWRYEGAHDLQVHVNVSPLELREADYLDVLHRVLRTCQLPPDALVLEITESAALERDGTSQHNLVSLASMGIEVALDDFGTGFASLDLLAATPARKLKLDRSFIASVGHEDDSVRGRAVIVQAAIGMGRSLGLDLVGEGVETSDQARTLLAWGCQYGQGYLFQRPVRPEELDLRSATALRSGSLTRTIDSGRLLSSESTDLALSLTNVYAAMDPDGGERRQQATIVAAIIAGVLGGGRNHVDTSVLLAGIADAPDRLSGLTDNETTCSISARELLDLLRIPPIIGRSTPPGAVARTAWAIATARANGEPTYDPVLLAAHPDPEVDANLRDRVDRWWADPRSSSGPRNDLRVLEQRLRERDDAANRLRALLGLARAIGSSGELEDVLELTADEARRSLGATSLSISRWEQDEGRLRTLINVGELAPWAETRPPDEIYRLADHPELAERLFERRMSVVSLDDLAADPAALAALKRSGKGSRAVVPIVIDDVVWGELYVSSSLGDPPFTVADGPDLSAVASFVGVAIARSQDVGRLARMVHEDPLTHLANRRRLDDIAGSLLADPKRDTPVSLLMIDVDGLKEINDEYGHAEGDRLLVTVADTLQRATMHEPDGLAGRLGGDEFCVVLTGDAERARQLMRVVQEQLDQGPPPQPRLSAGIATNHGGVESFGDLLERADAAQYAAKRRGIPIVLDTEAAALVSTNGATAPIRRRFRDMVTREQLIGVSQRWVDAIEDDVTSTRDRLTTLGELSVIMFDLNRWTLSVVQPESSKLHIDRLQLRRARAQGGSVPVTEEVYDLEDYPATVAAFETGSIVVDVNDPEADPAERELLADHGLQYMIGVACTDPGGTRWLLEMFGDAQSVSLRSSQRLVMALRDATFGGMHALASGAGAESGQPLTPRLAERG